MAAFIPYSRHSIGEEEILEVVDTLRSEWLTRGPKTIRFEEDFAKYVGVSHAVAVSSCTAALHLILAASGVGKGDEVVTTPMTFCATAEVIEYQEARPVFIDIDPETFNLDISLLEARINSKTKALIPVHYGGIPCNLTKIYDIARRHGLLVIEDAAHALGSMYEGKKIGSLGNPTAFSFYPTKGITTGEGGMVTTNDSELADRIRVMSLHGISRDAWKRYSSEGHWYYEIHELGYKYNFTDIQAALGIKQLMRLEEFSRIREKIAHMYFDAFSKMEEIELPAWYEKYFGQLKHRGFQNSWHLFVILLRLDRLAITRDQFMEEMKQRGIGTSVHFIPLHMQPYYAQKYGYQPRDFPTSEHTYRRIVSLPLYPTMQEHEIFYVIDSVKDIVTGNRTALWKAAST